jgi:hypothetical protein
VPPFEDLVIKADFVIIGGGIAGAARRRSPVVGIKP